jgi:hypothetical protein
MGATHIKPKKNNETTVIIVKIIKRTDTKLFNTETEVYNEAMLKKKKFIIVPPIFQKVSFKLANHNCN